MAQTSNNQLGDVFKPDPWDFIGAKNTFNDKFVEEILKEEIGESKRIIDTRAVPNMVKGMFIPMELALALGNYLKNLKEEMDEKEAAGAALAETLGGIIGAELGGAVGSAVPGVGTALGAVAGGYVGSKLGELGWQKFNEFLKALAERGVNPYAEKVRQNLNEGTRRIDPLVIDLNGDRKIDYNNSIRGRVYV